jgi:2-polyprenyl-3-methyl-5-hydroxy-6-metoxy-1,4-benzoquinol methylase
MFLRHGEIFVRFLEQSLPRTEGEVVGLLGIFSEFGVKEGARVLDLCCGIGRHSVALAQKGFQVTGIDLSEVSIRRAEAMAKEKGVESRTGFLVGDTRGLLEHVSLKGRKFEAVINMFTSLGYWDEPTDVSILRQAAQLADSGCLLVVDIANKDYLVRYFLPFGMVTFQGEPQYVLTEERKLNLETSRMNNKWTFYRKEGDDLKHAATVLSDHRVYSLHELASMIRSAGWDYLKAYGDFSLNPVSFDASRVIAVARSR